MANIKLASAGENVKLWNASNYSIIREFIPPWTNLSKISHTTTVADICWSYDGDYLASASSTGDTLMVCHVNDFFYIGEVSLKKGQQCVCFSRNTSHQVLSGGKNGELTLWDQHRLKKIYTGHTAPVTKVQFNWNDTAILSGNTRGDVILHNFETGLASFPLHSPEVKAIRDLKYSDTERSLFATASYDGRINLWDANKRRMIHSYVDAHRGASAMALAFSPVNDMLLMSVGLDRQIRCFDVKTKTAVNFATSDEPLTAMDFYPGGHALAVGSNNGNIYVYDLRRPGNPVQKFPAHKTCVQVLSYQTIKSNTASKSQGKANRSVAKRLDQPLSPPSAPRRRSASCSPKTGRNVAQERCKDQFGSTTTSSTVDHCNTSTGDTSGVSTVSKAPVVRQIPPYKGTEESILAAESLLLSFKGDPPSEQTAVTGSIERVSWFNIVEENHETMNRFKEEMKRFTEEMKRSMEDFFEETMKRYKEDLVEEMKRKKKNCLISHEASKLSGSL